MQRSGNDYIIDAVGFCECLRVCVIRYWIFPRLWTGRKQSIDSRLRKDEVPTWLNDETNPSQERMHHCGSFEVNVWSPFVFPISPLSTYSSTLKFIPQKYPQAICIMTTIEQNGTTAALVVALCAMLVASIQLRAQIVSIAEGTRKCSSSVFGP